MNDINKKWVDIFRNTKNREGFLKNPESFKSVHDEHLIRREVYNPNPFKVLFRRNVVMDRYISAARIPLGPLRRELEPDEFLLLPHGYYFAEPIGTSVIQYDMVVNFGDNIGIGNKNPSTFGT